MDVDFCRAFAARSIETADGDQYGCVVRAVCDATVAYEKDVEEDWDMCGYNYASD